MLYHFRGLQRCGKEKKVFVPRRCQANQEFGYENEVVELNYKDYEITPGSDLEVSAGGYDKYVMRASDLVAVAAEE